MKAVLVCGSPRKNGNTQKILEIAQETLLMEGIDTELVLLSDATVHPCIGCLTCKKTRDMSCAIKEDDFHEIFGKMLNADAIVVGTPVYFGCATSQTTSLLHRAGYVARNNGNPLSGKIGAPVVVARRAGQNFTYAQLVFFYTISDMTVVGSSYWNVAFGKNPGEVLCDEEAVQTVKKCMKNIAALLQCRKKE
ncbi:MAG: flavodoxin family protein [Spirochaetes bacterium]|nr:flavodoxin family protein [Spirochaetota bacterium]